MATKKHDETEEYLDAMLRVRLRSVEKERLRLDADQAGMTMSELVRRRYFGRPIVAHSDEVMIRELKRLGGLLKHVHNESQGAYSSDTATAIRAISSYIEQLVQQAK